MRLKKPWQPSTQPKTEDEEIAETEKMLKKTRMAVDLNLRIAKMAGANALAMLKEQMLGMAEKEALQSFWKTKTKGIEYNADMFMAKLDRIKGAYEFYDKVGITKDEIRERAEVALKQAHEDEFIAQKAAGNEGLLNLAPLMKKKMAEGKGADVAFKEAYEELSK